MVTPFIVAIVSEWIFLLAIAIAVRRTIAKSQQWVHFLQSSSISFLFAIGWALGLAMTGVVGTAATVLGAMFIIIGGLLGIYIFLIYGILSPTARSVWKEWCVCIQWGKYGKYSMSRPTTPAKQLIVKQQETPTVELKVRPHTAYASTEELLEANEARKTSTLKSSSSLEYVPAESSSKPLERTNSRETPFVELKVRPHTTYASTEKLLEATEARKTNTLKSSSSLEYIPAESSSKPLERTNSSPEIHRQNEESTL